MTNEDIDKEWAIIDIRLLSLREELESQESELARTEEHIRNVNAQIDKYRETNTFSKEKAKIVLLSEYSYVKYKLELNQSHLDDFLHKKSSILKNIAEIKKYIAIEEKALQTIENSIQNRLNVIQFDQRRN